jgi:hypothetical protein
MSHCAPLPVQAVTITHLADEAGIVRPDGAPPGRSSRAAGGTNPRYARASGNR